MNCSRHYSAAVTKGDYIRRKISTHYMSSNGKTHATYEDILAKILNLNLIKQLDPTTNLQKNTEDKGPC